MKIKLTKARITGTSRSFWAFSFRSATIREEVGRRVQHPLVPGVEEPVKDTCESPGNGGAEHFVEDVDPRQGPGEVHPEPGVRYGGSQGHHRKGQEPREQPASSPPGQQHHT